MAHNERKEIRAAGRIVDLLLDGKKTVLASALILVMAVMWIRVLIGHKPRSAAATSGQKQAAPAETQETADVRMVELPQALGRNDSIYRDCFNIRNWTHFRQSSTVPNTGTETEVPVVPPNHDEEVIQQVAQTLKLEAVIRNHSPRVFVNDRLLGVGDTFVVERGTQVLEFEVLRIYEDAVLVQCNDIPLTLKMAQSMEVRK